MSVQYNAIFYSCESGYFQVKIVAFFLILLKKYTVGTRQNCFTKAVLTSTHDLCFIAKLENNVYPGKPRFSNIKVGFRGFSLHGHAFNDGELKVSCSRTLHGGFGDGTPAVKGRFAQKPVPHGTIHAKQFSRMGRFISE